MSCACFLALPVRLGIWLRRYEITYAFTRLSRARLTSSLILRTAELRGRSRRSFIRSCSSCSNRAALSSYTSGWSQKLPMYLPGERVSGGVQR